MNLPLLHAPFELPKDGWYPGLKAGEYPIQLDVDPQTGLSQFGTNHTHAIQVIDATSLASLAATPTTSPEILIDYDHESLDLSKRTEAAGWIQQFKTEGDELFFLPRWSDTGGEAVKGGRYRYVSFVWKPNQCEVIENTPTSLRIRPLKIFNAGLTNNPNMKGVPPLSNRGDAPALPVRVAARPFAVSNRSAMHFLRGMLLANGGQYYDPRTGKTREWIGGRPWGHGGGGSSSGSAGGAKGESGSAGSTGATGDTPGAPVTQDTTGAAATPDNVDAVLAGLVDPTTYDPAQNEMSHVRPLGDASSSPQQDAGTSPATTFAPVRDTAARVKAIADQRDALIAQRPVEPKKPDFAIVDTRKLFADLMKQGKGTNEVTAAVKAAEAQNAQHKAALEKIKKSIRAAYPNDHKKQAAALTKYMGQLDAQYQKQHDAWSKVNTAIDKAVATANKLIADEQTRGGEADKLAQQKQQNADVKTAQKLADQNAKAIQKQVEADKADARRKATADAKAKAAADKPVKSPDAVSAISREMRRRNFYWQSLARGEDTVAQTLFPTANVAEDLKTVEDLARGVKSKNDEKAHAKALAELSKQAPSPPIVEQIP